MKFAKYFFRGIQNDSYVTKDNQQILPLAHLFFENNRNDCSINWKDDEYTLDFTFQQKKDNGEIQFKYGVAKLEKEFTDKSINKNLPDKLTFNREPLPENKYHGNLIFLSENKKVSRMVAGQLALLSQVILQKKN